MYGSRWLTALAGSVIALAGAPGDPIVRLKHLKAPMEDVGPFRVAIDHDSGVMGVSVGSDLLGLVRAAPTGLTARAAAVLLYERAQPSDADVERARRQLGRLVREKLVHERRADRPRDPNLYVAVVREP